MDNTPMGKRNFVVTLGAVDDNHKQVTMQFFAADVQPAPHDKCSIVVTPNLGQVMDVGMSAPVVSIRRIDKMSASGDPVLVTEMVVQDFKLDPMKAASIFAKDVQLDRDDDPVVGSFMLMFFSWHVIENHHPLGIKPNDVLRDNGELARKHGFTEVADHPNGIDGVWFRFDTFNPETGEIAIRPRWLLRDLLAMSEVTASFISTRNLKVLHEVFLKDRQATKVGDRVINQKTVPPEALNLPFVQAMSYDEAQAMLGLAQC